MKESLLKHLQFHAEMDCVDIDTASPSHHSYRSYGSREKGKDRDESAWLGKE